MEDNGTSEKDTETKAWTPPRIWAYERFHEGGVFGLLSASVIDETGQEYPPPSVEDFLNRNYKFLTLAGVFAAVVVYFSQLTDVPNRAITLGMVGGGAMFGIVLAMVLKHSFIAFLRGVMSGSVVHAMLYSMISFWLGLISISMIIYFSRHSAVAFSALDNVLQFMFLIVIMVVGFERIERKGRIIPPPPVQLGPKTESVYYSSGLIAMLLFVLIAVMIPVFWERFISFWTTVPLAEDYSTYLKNSPFLQMLLTFSVFILLTIAVALCAIITHFAVRVTTKLWDSKSP